MSAKFNILVAASIPLVTIVPMLACGGDDGAKVDSGIHVNDGHGSGSGSGSGSNAACSADSSYSPAFGSGEQGARDFPPTGSGSDMTVHEELWEGALNADTDVLILDLFQGYGGFGSGDIRNGTYNLAQNGDNAFSTCGVCVLMITNQMGTGSAATFAD
jgi:hypothetical protein